MTSSSDRKVRNVPPPEGQQKPAATPYSRFIPREELGSFASWTPDGFGGTPAPKPGVRAAEPPAPSGPSAEEITARLHEARQAGYQDGYRDGLAALDGFKKSHMAQMSAQVGALLQSFGAEMDGLEQHMAQALAQAATLLAKQVVRSELTLRPDAVVQVAQEAVNAVQMNARHITLRVHPDDHPLVALGAAEVLAARGARLLADPAVKRGGCIAESDVGVIDASIEARWAQASTQLGGKVAWTDSEGGEGQT